MFDNIVFTANIAELILKMLDVEDLTRAQQVSELWRDIIVDTKLWKMFLHCVCQLFLTKLNSCINLVSFHLGVTQVVMEKDATGCSSEGSHNHNRKLEC